jgi:hypothetical protein
LDIKNLIVYLASFTNYDAAVYNAVTAYAQGSVGPRGGGGNGGMGFKKGLKGGVKSARPMPKPQTLHYCDVCKISCAGPQVTKEGFCAFLFMIYMNV